MGKKLARSAYTFDKPSPALFDIFDNFAFLILPARHCKQGVLQAGLPARASQWQASNFELLTFLDIPFAISYN